METRVRDIARAMLPSRKKGYAECPEWPPDLFAIAAKLASETACYARARTMTTRLFCGYPDRASYVREVSEAGREWREKLVVPKVAQHLWRRLARSPERTSDIDRHQAWWDWALTLLAIADEASYGIGLDRADGSVYAALYAEDYGRVVQHKRPRLLDYLPNSACVEVPPWIASVQPKSRTAQVGSALRSWSHHLSLLPSVSEVATKWHGPHPFDQAKASAFNVLLVPYPYEIKGDAFRASTPHGRTGRYLDVSQEWLKNSARALPSFVGDLVSHAESDGGEVHAVVFPELAMDLPTAKACARYLYQRHRKVELFVTGIKRRVQGELDRNAAFGALLTNGATTWLQLKHHPWKIDSSQIRKYGLGHRLDLDRDWWEDVAVGHREVNF